MAANLSGTFYFGRGDPDNFGWPRYVNHQKDPSVRLVFVPGSKATDIEPFYMSGREITNGQYHRFIQQTDAKSQTRLAGWS